MNKIIISALVTALLAGVSVASFSLYKNQFQKLNVPVKRY